MGTHLLNCLTRWRRFDFAITHISHWPQPEYTIYVYAALSSGIIFVIFKLFKNCFEPIEKETWSTKVWIFVLLNTKISHDRDNMEAISIESLLLVLLTEYSMYKAENYSH